MPTQEEMVLAHLKSGAKLTGLECLEKFGCIHLPGIIHSLRQAGYEIETGKGSAYSPIAKKKKTFAVYKLISTPAIGSARQRTWF